MEDKQNNKNPLLKNNGKGPKIPVSSYWIYAIALVFIAGIYFFSQDSYVKDVPWSDFQKYAENNCVEKIVVYNKKNTLQAFIRPDSVEQVFNSSPDKLLGKKPSIMVSIPSAEKFSDFYEKTIAAKDLKIDVSYESGSDMTDILISLLPFILLIAIWIFIMRKMSGGSGGGSGGVFSVGKSKAQLYDKGAEGKVTFKDVAGLAAAKEELEEMVEFLKNPTKYTEIGAKIPKGALLVGPPGTGKTLLAKAVAGEADVPFFSMSGADFVEMFVGVGASRVRDLFKQAKEKSPCIIFIDEIDAIGRARGKNPNMGSNDERENTLNQLLTEMDGFGTNSGVIILAATNRADILDKALLRAGRFDRQIYADLPDIKDRKQIFKVHLRPIKVDDSVDLEFLARQTPGFSGADIANVCNEAALIAARNGKKIVQESDFTNAVDRIVGGLENKNKITTADERKTIAVHEAGHATLSWYLEHADPLVKVTIVPRGKALGAAWYLPEERQITTKEQMLDEMCALLGGRAAEEIYMGHISSGAVNDLERVTKQAYAMISYMGMSDALPNISYYDSSGQAYGFTKPYSEDTGLIIDQEVQKLINSQYERAKQLLSTHKEGHNKLASLLLEKEVIFADDLKDIFGIRQWLSRSEELIKEAESLANTLSSEDQSETKDIPVLDAPDLPKDTTVAEETKTEESL